MVARSLASTGDRRLPGRVTRVRPVRLAGAGRHRYWERKGRSTAIGTEILIILALVLINGVLSGAEIAVIAVRRTRLRELAEAGSGAARAVQDLRDQPERFLATVQIGITVVGAAAGAFGGATFARDLEPVLREVPALAPHARELSLGLVVLLVSYLSLVLGELVPKSLALKGSERYSLLIGRPLLWLSAAARPLVWFMTLSSNALLRLFGDRTSFTETRLSSEELQQMIEEAAKVGAIHPRAGEIASRALEFPGLTAAEVMVPRRQVVSIRRSASREEFRAVLREKRHSRFPVHEGSPDHVVGYISLKDALAVAWDEPRFVLEDLLRAPYLIPEATPAVELLSGMRQRHVPFAVVVDGEGVMVGIVTLEDLLEELVGELVSEHAREVPERFHREPGGAVTVLGTVPIREVNRELGFDLPVEGDWTTIAGLCLGLAARVPAVGARLLTDNGFTLEVTDASARRVRAVRISPPAEAGPS